MYDPDVSAVLRAHRWYESGQLREHWGDDPPYWLVLAIGHYQGAIERVRTDAIERSRKQNVKPPDQSDGQIIRV
jgi:hypothetical protein